MGVVVDERATNQGSQGKNSQRAEFEISGTYETVLKNNMDQLQWTTLSMLLLSLSTALLAVAQEFHEGLAKFHPSVATLTDGTVEEWLAFGVDFSEQVRLPQCLYSLGISGVTGKECGQELLHRFISHPGQVQSQDIAETEDLLCRHQVRHSHLVSQNDHQNENLPAAKVQPT
jgi:hypothetical protein